MTTDSKLVQYILDEARIAPKDMMILPGGNIFGVRDDLKKGLGNAAMLEEPYTTQLLQNGNWSPLVDLTSNEEDLKYLGGDYEIGLTTSDKMIKDHPEVVQEMTNAIVKALRYLQTHSAADIVSILPEGVTWEGKAQYSQGIQHSLAAFSQDGVITESGVKNWIQVDKEFGSIKADQQIDVAALYTNKFVSNIN